MWTNLPFILLLTWGVTLIPAFLITPQEHFKIQNTKRHYTSVARNVGSPLLLTPYIEAGKIEEARNLSAVKGGPFLDDIPSYSGFFTVNKEYNSNLFFWFFPAENGYDDAPLLLWLQGGPGSSSLFGLFTEIGPFTVAIDNSTLVKNPYSWQKNHSIIFIDNPVGTGFSFTDNEDGYATTQEQIGSDLYSAMTQFLTVFPELQKVPFFVTGESYAGKYVPALAFTIHEKNPTSDLKINLEGIAIGDGYTDPITILHYSDVVYELGLVDTNTRNEMSKIEEQGRTEIQEGKLADAFYTMASDLGEFYSASEYTNIYNFLDQDESESETSGDYYEFLAKEEVRLALHVGDAEYTEGGIVYDKLIPDFMKSVRPWVEELIDNYRVLFYNGQMDIIVAYPLSVNMYNELKFGAADEYHNATRVTWRVDGKLAGYMKSAGKFTEVLVRNAGHMVPSDQPTWALDLITRFTKNNIQGTNHS